MLREGTYLLIVLSVLSLLVQNGRCKDDVPEVKTPQGTYKGIVLKARGGREIAAFKGVPYAKPPVGPLRFKEPVELEKSDGVFEANKDKVCFQRAMNFAPNDKNDSTLTKFNGEEDCLYLNIYRPKDVNVEKKLPVYVFIHGGGYITGTGGENWAGPRYFFDNNRNLVMVSINYRLGILGFLSANDINLPGNNGMKDQSLALKWVKENIELFGGDPNSITIGGVSAGGSSVNLHMHSKTSKGLFHRAISQSGTADCPWALKPLKKAREIGSHLISFLGCPHDPKELMECLQKFTPEALFESEEALKVNSSASVMYLTPVIENDSPTAFMTKESLEEGSDIPWMNGVTNEEGIIFYHFMTFEDSNYTDLKILKEDYKHILPVKAYYGPRDDDEVITEKIVKHYFGDKGFNAKTVPNFIKLLSDRMFNQGYLESAKKHKGKLYLYNLAYRGNVTFAPNRPEEMQDDLSHGDDIFLLFDVVVPGLNTTLNQEDTVKSNEILDLLYNFIAQGDPTPESHAWEPSDASLKYFHITNSGSAMSSDTKFNDRAKFFEDLNKEYDLWKY